MTAAMGATPGSTYSTSISSGALAISTSNPALDQSPKTLTVYPDLWALATDPFVLGDTLSGSITFTSSGAGAPGSASINFANYQGLTSGNLATQSAAFTQLANDLTASPGATGSNYRADFMSRGVLLISSSNGNESYQITSQDVMQAPTLGSQELQLSAGFGGGRKLSFPLRFRLQPKPAA